MALKFDECKNAATIPIIAYLTMYILFNLWTAIIVPNLYKYFIINVDLIELSNKIVVLLGLVIIAWAGFNAAKKGQGLVGGALAGLLAAFAIFILISILLVLFTPYSQYKYIFTVFDNIPKILFFIIQNMLLGAIGAFIGKRK